MSDTELDADRDALRVHMQEAYRLDMASAAANAEFEAAADLVVRWEARGRLDEFLRPLLDSAEDPQVRLQVVSILIGRQPDEVAVPALEELRDGGDPVTARFADGLIRRRRQSNG